MRRVATGLGIGLGIALAPATAAATWSIVAVDPQTQEVGVAVASCVEAPFGSTILPSVAGLAPGVGALAAQAVYSQARRDQALALLTGGASAQEVIDGVTAADGQAAVRQYGVVTLAGQTATFTGASTQAWAGDRQSRGATVQGNILYGPEVADDALAAFEAEAPRCPFTLADRLMLALEAGSARGGDNRCSEEQSALAAALRVALPGDDPDASYLDLRIPSQPDGGDNPVALLRIEYDQWRQRNPPDDSGCMAGTSTGGETEGSAGSTSTPTSDGPPPSDDTNADSGPTPPLGTTATSEGSTSRTTDAAGDTGGDTGCGCRTESPGPPSLVLALPLLALARRRAR